VMSVCHTLGLPDPLWFEEESVRDRVEANCDNMPLFRPDTDGSTLSWASVRE
jgi:hypothetical protein